MKRFFAIAAILLASTAAHAGDSYNFEVGGHTIHIDAPSNCRSTSCVSVSVPGIYDSRHGGKRSHARDDDFSNSDSAKADTSVNAPAPQSPVASAPVATLAPVEQASVAPAPVRADPPPAAAAPAPTVVASAPVAPPVQKQQAPAPASLSNSPLGVWLTEEKEGKVRIEQCGANLCGYSVNAKTDANGDKVLINMKPVGDVKWSGRIFDPNSGSTYDSTIALKNNNSLRVQGCAFGGMFCGGQNWTRVN